ncbi:MAG: hypothetical protein SGPRY_010639 [Prymnesium sp.]
MVPASRVSAQMMDVDGLKAQAEKLNPVVKFFDPLKLSEGEFWGGSTASTIGFLREVPLLHVESNSLHTSSAAHHVSCGSWHVFFVKVDHSEIKHGRVAMAGFVGYIVHANDIRIPGDKIAASVPTGLSPPATWDALPDAAKWQIILFIGFLEFWRENAYILENEGEKHYMRGGKPGYFPSFDLLPHPVPFKLFDPFGLSKNASEEKKASGLLKEVNNGRLAMLGLFGFLCEAKIPGSVPGLSGIVLPYDGEVMAPF